MKQKGITALVALIFVLSVAAGQAQSVEKTKAAMAACGPADQQFDVTYASIGSAQPPPPDQAVVYVFGNPVTRHLFGAFAPSTVRVGMDGKWVGALKPTGLVVISYVAIPVKPGIHHFCSEIQGTNDPLAVALNVIDMKAGESYYLLSETLSEIGILPPVMTLDEINTDEAKMLIVQSLRAVAHDRVRKKQ